MEQFNLVPLLDYISPDDYETWVSVGMALQHEGYSCAIWDDWSKKSSKYHPGECPKKWRSFRGDPRPVTGATITDLAKKGGWKPKTGDDYALSWDAEINDELVIVDKNYLEVETLKEPTTENWKPVDEIIDYLSALFHEDEHVGFVMESIDNADKTKKVPASAGSYALTVGDVIRKLRKYNSVREAIGDYDEKGGAWVRFNPLDGHGAKDANVTDYRFTLVESDDTSPEEQIAIIKQLELPVAALVYSGKKSVHAIVHIDAYTETEYRKRVDQLYEICEKNGLKVDAKTRNPSRLSRLPGVIRDGHKQFLVATNIGRADYKEWLEWFTSLNDDLPELENLSEVWDDMPELAPELIYGVLRQGHKMLISGPSKAGKSFALIELAIAIAENQKWLGFNCTQGKVAYVNLELDRASCLHRFKDVYEALGIPPKNINNIQIWNLRGKAEPMDKLAGKLIRRVKDKGFIAVIIDPIYKVITGDENAADQMAKFCNQFDKVVSECGCAVIYCHHHSKGQQGMKKAMDRASGSGVFARDPDAMLDMIELTSEPLPGEPETRSAWRITGVLREFKSFVPINVWFDWPIHTIDTSGVLAMAAEDGSLTAKQDRGRQAQIDKKNRRQDEIEDAINALDMGEEITVQTLADYFGRNVKTIRNDLKELGYEVKNNVVIRK